MFTYSERWMRKRKTFQIKNEIVPAGVWGGRDNDVFPTFLYSICSWPMTDRVHQVSALEGICFSATTPTRMCRIIYCFGLLSYSYNFVSFHCYPCHALSFPYLAYSPNAPLWNFSLRILCIHLRKATITFQACDIWLRVSFLISHHRQLPSARPLDRW